MPIVVGWATAPGGTITCTPSGLLTVPPCGPINAETEDAGGASSFVSS